MSSGPARKDDASAAILENVSTSHGTPRTWREKPPVFPVSLCEAQKSAVCAAFCRWYFGAFLCDLAPLR